MDIRKFNCIQPADILHPIDLQDEKNKPYIKVFYTDADDIIIAGMISFHGVYWLSVTDAGDTETIRAIFDCVSKLEPTEIANIHTVIGHTYYTDAELRLCYFNIPGSADEILAYHQRIRDSFRMKAEGGKYYDIQKYNCLTPENASKPKYMPNPDDRCIRVSYASNHDIIITGVADNNFIYWLSVTKADDIETNRMIFDYLHETVPTIFGSESFVLPKTQYTYAMYASFYCAELEHADDILTHRNEKKKQCKKQETDSRMLRKMKSDIKKLSVRSSDPFADYEKYKELISHIQSQTHLRCSDDPAVVSLYNELYELCSDIYNAYMTAAH